MSELLGRAKMRRPTTNINALAADTPNPAVQPIIATRFPATTPTTWAGLPSVESRLFTDDAKRVEICFQRCFIPLRFVDVLTNG